MRDDPIKEIQEAFEQLNRQFAGGLEGGRALPGMGGIAVDVLDRESEYVVTADLPGYDADDIDVRLTDGQLHVDAERDTGSEGESASYVFRERRRESVSRSVRLPEPVDEDAVEATYDDGVLTVTLPKTAAGDEGTSIEVN